MTTADLAAIAAALQQGTQGPFGAGYAFCTDEARAGTPYAVSRDPRLEASEHNGDAIALVYTEADARLIAALLNALPLMLQEALELAEEVAACLPYDEDTAAIKEDAAMRLIRPYYDALQAQQLVEMRKAGAVNTEGEKE